jgi:replicative DNA helicase
MKLHRENRQKISYLPDFGKVPPQANDMEEAVLGGLMIDKFAIDTVMSILKPESFYREAHQKIYKAITDLFSRHFPADLITITEELRSNNELDAIGGPVYLTQLMSKVVTATNIEYHAQIVAQKYIQRELIRISTELQTRSFDDSYDISELLEYAETELLQLSGTINNKKAKKLSVIIDGVIDVIAKIINGEIKLVGIPSGFTSLDRITGGFKGAELTLIAGRPSQGKTALALQIAKNATGLKYPIAIFSHEMSSDELGRRYLSGVSNKTNVQLLNGNVDLDHLLKTSEELLPLKLYIDDCSSLTVMEMRSKTRKLIIEYGIKMIIVDYLQLMKGIGDTREQEVASIGRGLKGIAKDLNIAVVALSQLNRRLEGTANKMPNLSDLRESGSLEQEADIVMFVYRPEYYKISTICINGTDVDTKGLMIVPVAKNRNGAVCEIQLKCNECLSNIYEETEPF